MKKPSNKNSKANKICPLETGAYLIDRIPDEMIRMPKGFDHPNPKWKNQDGFLIVDETQLDQSIRFKGLIKNHLFDALFCLTWESIRTQIFLMSLFQKPFPIDELFDGEYGFLTELEGFPGKPYLSNSVESRKEWFSKTKPEITPELINDFFTPTPGFEFFNMIGSKFHKVPLLFYVDPTMGKEEFCKQARLQFGEINRRAKSKHKQLIEKGFPFVPIKKNRRTNAANLEILKILGHYRLSTCLHLSWKKVKESYGESSYKEERTYREGLKKHFKEFFFKAS